MNWNEFFNKIKEYFSNNSLNILNFIGVLFVGILCIKLFMNVIKRILNKTKIEKITMQFMLGIVKVLLYVFLAILLLNIIGVQSNGIVTAFSAILVAVVVALESNISNFANGLIIISSHMFNKGDYIIIYDDVEGVITDINFLFTTLITVDNRRITLPNSKMVNSSVTNNGAFKIRRVQITFSVAYESDVELVKKVVTDVMKSNGKVYLDKPIFCRLKTMSASSLDFFSYCWVDKDDYWDVYYYLMENVYNEFKRNNITVPFSQVEVRNRTDNVVMPVIGNSMPTRVEKIREIKHSFDLENSDLTELFKRGISKKKNSSRKRKEQNNNNSKNKTSNVSKVENNSKKQDENVKNAEKTSNINKENKNNTKIENEKTELNSYVNNEELNNNPSAVKEDKSLNENNPATNDLKSK